jgi:hypothetical protein
MSANANGGFDAFAPTTSASAHLMDYADRVSGLKLVADGEKVTNQLRAQK